jgi:hypothetical protein
MDATTLYLPDNITVTTDVQLQQLSHTTVGNSETERDPQMCHHVTTDIRS